jgi:hypothetical protein
MPRLFLLIFSAGLLSAQIQLLNPSDNGQVSLSKINGNFTYLNGSKIARWSGSGAPGNFPLSVLGDFYLDVTNNLAYQCFATLNCTTVGSGNWTLVGSGGGGGTPGGGNGSLQWNSAGTFAGLTVGGDGTLNTSTGVLTITKTGGVAFANSATVDTTDATNITSGTLPNARLVGIPNTALANSSIQINTSSPLAGGATVSLGGSVTITCPTCGPGTGTVTNTGALASGRLVIGNGGTDVSVVGSLGTTTTVYHGNAGGAGSFGAVSLTADVSGILPGANGGTGNGFFAVSGPAASLKTYTLPNASTTILTTNAPVTLLQGGTGQDLSAIVKGGLIVGTAANTVAVKVVGVNGTVLTANSAVAGGVEWAAVAGTGTVTQVDTTGPITGGPITASGTIACATCTTSAAALTANQLLIGAGSQGMAALGTLGTTVQVLHGNAGGAPTFGAVVLSTDVSGTLPVANGGTALTTYTSGGVVCATGATTLASSGALAANGVVIGGGAGVCPSTITAGGAGTLLSGGAGAPAFSATPTLGVAGATAGTLSLTGVTSGTVKLKTAAAAGTWDLTLPIDGGTSGYLLSTNGSGVTSWIAGGAGTVTVVASGSLTSTAMVTGGGTTTLQTPCATCTLSAGGNFSIPGTIAAGVGGSAAGTVELFQGTAPTPTANSIDIAAPASVTAYTILLPGSVGSTGYVKRTVSGSTATESLVSNVSLTIASGAKALSTSAISSAACSSAQTDTATGTLTTDTIIATFNGDPSGVTGYVPLTAGGLTIYAYPTADTVSFKVCNFTSSSISPGAITLNWRVVR